MTAFDGGEETYVPRRHRVGGGTPATETAQPAGDVPPARALNYIEQELADHTCSFGDACAVRVRAKQMGLGQ